MTYTLENGLEPPKKWMRVGISDEITEQTATFAWQANGLSKFANLSDIF